ncbi:MAG: enoyl-CoA hydratase-related protein [Paenibacillaceae bacterium]
MSGNLTENNGLVHVVLEDSLAVITLNHPPVNALNTEVLEELNSILDGLSQKTEIRVAVITGAGEKVFVAGADIKQFPDLDEASGKALSLHGQGIFNKISQLNIPVICAVNGFALGGGCELALACDIRVAAMNAKFGLPEVGLGIIPGYGGTQRLARLVGAGKAKELIFSGEAISAEEAYRLGLVEKLVPVGEALQTAKDLARTISSKGPIAVQNAKKAIDLGLGMSLPEGMQLEASLFGGLCATEDKNEGVKAFFEKRSANFQGK